MEASTGYNRHAAVSQHDIIEGESPLSFGKKLGMAGVAIATTFALTTAGSGAYAASSSDSGQIEIFSWWTAGGEAQGLAALLKVFQSQYPHIKVINEAVAGGAGSNAKAVLASRMQAGNPPDTFQAHADQELDAWVYAGKMEPLNFLYKSQGWYHSFPKELISLCSVKGNVYSVPVDIHRGNVLWYNPKLFAKYHLAAPSTFSAFFKDAAVLKSHGVTALALGDKDTWESTMLWENVLLGTVGPKTYEEIWQGKVPFTSPGVKQATETFIKMLSYANSNHTALEWQDASQLVADGKAGMNLMGDWAKGFYTSLNLKPVTGFEWASFPGTGGDFEFISDTFGLPKGVKDRSQVVDFLKVLGSKAGQDAFNPLKGSIPARTDGNPALYDVYSRQAMQDFRHLTLVPSLAHGEAANPGFLTSANNAIQVLVANHNINQFIQALQTAAQENPLQG